MKIVNPSVINGVVACHLCNEIEHNAIFDRYEMIDGRFKILLCNRCVERILQFVQITNAGVFEVAINLSEREIALKKSLIKSANL
jgi:hypothetical protein